MQADKVCFIIRSVHVDILVAFVTIIRVLYKKIGKI